MRKRNTKLNYLLGFAAGVTAVALFNEVADLIDIFSSELSPTATPLLDFLRGAGKGLYITGFLVVMIIIINLYRRNGRGEKLFSPSLIYYVSLFGAIQIVASLFMNIGDDSVDYVSRYQLVIGLLIIIFAQVFRRALVMQREEELTI